MMGNYGNILALLDEAGEINSRKKIQKIVYFLQKKFSLFNEKFSLHQFGPYSSELQIELDQLDEAGLISQRFSNFVLEDKGRTFLKKDLKISEKFESDEVKQLIKKLNDIPPFKLESMATIAYFEQSYGRNKEELRKAIHDIKPHLDDVFEEAWGMLDEFELHTS